jgi:hypothetical protein
MRECGQPLTDLSHRTWPVSNRHRLEMTSPFDASRLNARRRRMLILLSDRAFTPAENSQPKDDLQPVPADRPPKIPPFTMSEERTSIDRSFVALDSQGFQSLPMRLMGESPVSWLFVGDSFTPKNVTDPRPWRLFTSRFAGAIQAHFHRSKDMFIDSTFPQARLSEVVYEFDKRVAKFEPDICFLSLSLADADTKSTERFERTLARLIQWSKRYHCQLVLQTPPCLPSRNDSELTRRLILVESIRGISAEHEVPLVDHWDHWELAAAHTNHIQHWIDAETQTPGEQGHRQLAMRLIKDLKLKDIAKPAFPVEVNSQLSLDQ